MSSAIEQVRYILWINSSLDNMKNRSASVNFCKNLEACNDWNGAVIELPAVVSIGGCPYH